MGSARCSQRGDHQYRVNGLPHPRSAAPLLATFVSMGNPHATFYVDDVTSVDLEKVGPQIENDRAFPRRINVHAVQIHSR